MIEIPHTAGAPPPYSRSVSSHFVDSGSAANNSCLGNFRKGDVHECSSRGVVLSFAQRKYEGTRLPAFGRGGIVNGEIYLKSTSHIESVTVVLKGEIKTVIESSCRPTVTSKVMLLNQNYAIWPISEQDNTPISHILPFSFSFPSTARSQEEPLPASFLGALTEGTIRIRYTVIAHVRRTGWRGNTTVETEIFYLPRTVNTVPLSISSSFGSISAPKESPDDMRIVELPAKQSTAGKQLSSEVKVHLACPLSITLSKDHAAPFNIYVSSPTQPLRRLLQLVPHISVRLVRIVKITSRGISTTEESACAHGVIQAFVPHSEAGGGESVVINGSIPLFDTIWTSWVIEG
ncbi:hypothetical protein FRC12_017798, partial [Ceratobasidium sp. 428]